MSSGFAGLPIIADTWVPAGGLAAAAARPAPPLARVPAQLPPARLCRSFHWLRYMGPQVALLGVDMRSERSKARILPPAAYGVLQAAVGALPARLQHLVVLSGVPLVFPAVRCCSNYACGGGTGAAG